MYAKAIQVPFHMRQYEALTRRLQPGAALDTACARYQRVSAGYHGEQSLDYPLSYLRKDAFHIFHNLRLHDHVHFFQLDFLVLCARFALILEVKNIAGKLIFDTDLHQLIRESDAGVDVFDDPISQSERLAASLGAWLRERGVVLPIMPRVVITSSAQIQLNDPSGANRRKIVRRANLKAELLRMDERFGAERLSANNMEHTAAALLAGDQPLVIDPFQALPIRKSDIRPGIQCPKCGFLPMTREKQHWRCAKCAHQSMDAHIVALRDYALIFGRAITNKQCRDFLGLSSDFAARRMLHNFSDHFNGENKARVYYLAADFLK